MNWVAGFSLILSWALWLLARYGGQEGMFGWAFVVAYLGAGVALLLVRGTSGSLATALKYFGAGFLLKAAGEVAWLTLFADGSTGGVAVLPSLPYYVSSVLFAIGAWQLYKGGENLLGFPRSGTWIALLLATILSVGLPFITGELRSDAELGFWTDTIDSIISAFAAFLLIGVAFLTAGGNWSRWTLPLGVAFTLLLFGDLYYTLTADEYSYGSPSDWMWLMETTVVFLMLINNRAEAEPAELY